MPSSADVLGSYTPSPSRLLVGVYLPKMKALRYVIVFGMSRRRLYRNGTRNTATNVDWNVGTLSRRVIYPGITRCKNHHSEKKALVPV